MKKIFVLSILVVFLSSCNKLTDKNIIGIWNISEYKEDGISISILNNSYFEFTESGTVSLYFGGALDNTGTYSINSDGDILTINGINYNVNKKGKTMTLTYNGFGSEEWILEKQ